jgi:hypothetical protein
VNRRSAITLALALCLLGCSAPKGEPVDLLTGIEACYAGGQRPSYAGVLAPDPEYGTQIDGRPVMWPVGYTGLRLTGGEIAVLDRSGNVVATTGRAYAISGAPRPRGEKGELMERIGAIAAPDCYPWDFEEVHPRPT